MRRQRFCRWLLVIASSGCLFQAAPGGCPNGVALKGALSTGIQSILSGVIGAYVKSATNDFFDVST